MDLFVGCQTSLDPASGPHEANTLYRRDFEKLLLEAVDEQLTSLGESSKQALYYHLERGFNIKKHEIPRKTGAFADAMEKIFGQGADYLEILIMKKLHSKIGLGVKLSSPDLTFIEYVEAAERRYSQHTSEEKQETRHCRRIKVKC
jgi:hypothetical protein